MALTHQDTNVNQLIINKLNKQEYDNLSQVSSTELYLVEEQLDSTVTQGSTNPVQSGAVYDAIQDNHEIIFCHMLSGEIFNETVIECTEVNGEIFDPQELIDRPNDPRPLFPDGNYYYATNTNKVYSGEIGDNEFTDVTASVMMSGDETKLYCDIDDNKLYRYDGTNFIMVGGGGVSSYNDLTDKPLSVENSKVKYTLSDGTTKLTLAQEADLKSVAFSGSYNDLTDKLQNATTSTAGLMSADDKYMLCYFKEISINQLSSPIPPNTPIGFVKFSIDIINCDIKTYGLWNVATIGQLNLSIAGRSQYGYGIVPSGVNYTRTNLIVKCGIKNNQVYIWLIFPDSSYNSNCKIVIYGHGAYYAQPLDYATLNESEFSFINYLNINAI